MLTETRIDKAPVRLGACEHQICVHDDVQCANVLFMADLTTIFDGQDIEIALQQLQKRHEVLQFSISKKYSGFDLMPQSDYLNKSISLSYAPLKEYGNVCSRELDRAFLIGDYPLIRCYYFSNENVVDSDDALNTKQEISKVSSIVICISHAIIDGVSGMYLMVDLLNLIIAGKKVPDEKLITQVQPVLAKVLPPKYQGFKGTISAYKHYIAQAKKLGHAKQFPSFTPIISPKRQIHTCSLVIALDRFEQLRMNNKNEKISVNSLLAACWLLAVRECFGDENSLPLSLAMPINLRSHLQPKLSNTALGLYIGLIRLSLDLSGNESVFDVAKKISIITSQGIDSGEAHTVWQALPPKFLSQIGDMGKQAYLRLIFNGLLPTISAWTNLGKIENLYPEIISNELNGTVKNLSFSVMGSVPVPFTVALVSFNKELTINISYSKKMLEEVTAEMAVTKFEKKINETLM